MSKNKYIGITIGPIGELMSIMTKPAALWESSYLFSDLAKRLCKSFRDNGIVPEDFATPFIQDKSDSQTGRNNSDELFPKNGVGLFHDHIIFKNSANLSDKIIKGICQSTVNELSDTFEVEKPILSQFVRIFVAKLEVSEDQNPIVAFGKILDCLELSGNFVPASTGNELINMLSNSNVNDTAKKFEIDTNEWQLLRDGKFKDLESIALAGKKSGLKKDNYYCILRADGDYMGTTLQNLETGQIRAFSYHCFQYSKAAADLVGKYGGVTIYAGGDDLFALLPCEGNVDGEHGTVLTLIEKIRETFANEFEEYIKKAKSESKPALSFGVLISYIKFPLYEAVNRSAELLFAKAKGTEGKNTVALELQKHSGQSVCVLLKGEDAVNKTDDLLQEVIGSRAENTAEDKDAVLLSALYKIALFRTLFDGVKEEQVNHLFRNTFDSDFHLANENKQFLHDRLPELYREEFLTGHIHDAGQMKASPASAQMKASPASALSSVLRILKFFVEKKDEREV